jgi:hypothetical protein
VILPGLLPDFNEAMSIVLFRLRKHLFIPHRV